MPHYLLSVHMSSEAGPADHQQAPPSPEQMQKQMAEMETLEADMHDRGAWVFSARLHGPDASTVIRSVEGERLLTDGPYAESKEHMAGFYIISASDLDAALDWGDRVSTCIGMPIEVRPFADFKA